jgi:hypothetical protein
MKQAKSQTVIPIARPVTALETIDPQTAREMLATSAGNRSISKPRVDSLASAIAAGDWKPWASPIQFNTRGELINGHHRLTAVILANRAVQQCVVRHVPDDTIEAIDLGRARTLGDVLSMPTKHYVASANELAAIVNKTALMLTGSPAPLSPSAVTRYRQALGDDLVASAMRWRRRAKDGRLPSPSAVAAALMFVYRTNGSDKSLQFCEQVSESVGAAGDPAHTVARYLTTHGRSVSPFEVLSRIAGAHLAALAGRSLARSVRADEAAEKCREQARETWARIALGLNK